MAVLDSHEIRSYDEDAKEWSTARIILDESSTTPEAEVRGRFEDGREEKFSLQDQKLMVADEIVRHCLSSTFHCPFTAFPCIFTVFSLSLGVGSITGSGDGPPGVGAGTAFQAHLSVQVIVAYSCNLCGESLDLAL